MTARPTLISNSLPEAGRPVAVVHRIEEAPPPGAATIVERSLNGGFVGGPDGLVFVTDRELFDQVQALLKSNSVDRVVKRTRSGALLMGKLFDDRGNVMSPSYSTKKGVRYRFYVSSALLRGRKAEAGAGWTAK